ncbi:hypothetical protein [Desulforhopalus sp. IMCC35007]|uniref:hypothetical protein n=1 Tax=Desulforhopalus sp. IMCC35007 TaxID=2569543 RepID=UPI0010ADAFCE|nr:hypothetical protein [Desulforhopalus sp. IMCC35007]TKB08738.1 hypothetical protein FCL48_11910 [Desulforhopalus sp. IMCC35007]
MKNRSEALLEELDMYVQYGVPENDLKAARAVIHNYRDDERILRLLREYYVALPEAREEPVHSLNRLMEQSGVGLFVIVCTSYSYLYVISPEEVLLLGEYRKEVPEEVLSFFGYGSQAAFLKDCPAIEKLKPFPSGKKGAKSGCPVCGVLEGEEHLLGCIVEICPWCEGTLNSCNCRFEQLKIDEIETEEQLETFSELLEAKGRIPYTKEQNVSFPGTSEGLDKPVNAEG